MRYGDDFYAGAPVVTHKAYGKGHVYYVGADMEQAFYSDFYGKAAKEAGIQAPLGFVPAVIYGAADEIMQPLATRVLKKKK